MRNLRYRDMSEEATFELNLAPMMDMMVSIIPFMLIAATFLQVLVISVPLPQPVANALAQDRAKTDREVSLATRMDDKVGFVLNIRDEKGKVTTLTVPKVGGQFDYAGLHKKLVEQKQRYPKIFRLELNPDETISYDLIVKAMDASRNMENADPKINIDGADTPLLFPDVILANVME